jgi:hypothetical protein
MNVVNQQQAKLSLLPLLLFVLLFLGTGLYLQSQGVAYAFYQLPGPVAIIPALVLAIWLNRAPLNQSIDLMVKGAGNSNIITMCIIYLLAGAFAAVAQGRDGECRFKSGARCLDITRIICDFRFSRHRDGYVDGHHWRFSTDRRWPCATSWLRTRTGRWCAVKRCDVR